LAIHADKNNFLEAQLPVFDFGDIVELGGEARNTTKPLAFFEVKITGGRAPEGRYGSGTLTREHGNWR
jgi:hypothetical protein